jgi:hypothetical protein
MLTITLSILGYLLGAYLTFNLWCWRFPPTLGKGLFYNSNLIHNLNQSIELNHDEYYVKGWSLTGDYLWYDLKSAFIVCVFFGGLLFLQLLKN